MSSDYIVGKLFFHGQSGFGRFIRLATKKNVREAQEFLLEVAIADETTTNAESAELMVLSELVPRA